MAVVGCQRLSDELHYSAGNYRPNAAAPPFGDDAVSPRPLSLSLDRSETRGSSEPARLVLDQSGQRALDGALLRHR